MIESSNAFKNVLEDDKIKGVKMEEYEKFAANRKKIRKENEKVLERFQQWLVDKGLSNKTIHRHVDNVDFYINEFLLYDDFEKPEEGVYNVDMFLGYWFIRKAMASVSQIKQNITSLKKFYKFMYEKGAISKEALDDMLFTIKEEKSEWFATVARYDDPSIETMEEAWGMDDF